MSLMTEDRWAASTARNQTRSSLSGDISFDQGKTNAATCKDGPMEAGPYVDRDAVCSPNLPEIIGVQRAKYGTILSCEQGLLTNAASNAVGESGGVG